MLATLLFAVVGVGIAVRRVSNHFILVALLLVVGYHVATVVVVGIDAYARHRSVISPLLYPFAAIGLLHLFQPKNSVGLMPGPTVLF